MNTDKDKDNWIYLGSCGVDSGQLLIIDPGYIKNKDREEIKILGVKYWGEAEEFVDKELGTYSRFVKCDNHYDAELLVAKIEAIARNHGRIMTHIMTDNLYDTCWMANENSLGSQLNNYMGVVFSPGFGDGVYEVWANVVNYGELGERIKEVKIICVYDEEEEG